MVSASPFVPVSSHRASLGEGLCFDPNSSRVYWLDIKEARLFSVSADAVDTEEISIAQSLSSIGLAETHDFVCTSRNGFGFLDLDNGTARYTQIVDPEEDLPGNRFNDGKVDPSGGYIAGTMKDAEDERTGSWWRLAADGTVKRLVDGFFVTNGPAFGENGDLAYLVDSFDGRVLRFTLQDREIDGYRKHISVDTKAMGHPDGMTVDREGFLWIAFWDGYAVRRFAPDGQLDCEFKVPARRPTSIEIIEDRIFVTTASIGVDAGTMQDDGRLLTAQLDRQLGQLSRYRFNDQAWG
ncbi:MAG: SMP-30/gluconolactonase/LRE family protein [Pseudomonadota bacterium]